MLAEQRGMSVFKVYDNNLGISVTFDFGSRIEGHCELVMFIRLAGRFNSLYSCKSEAHFNSSIFSPDAFPPERLKINQMLY